MIVALKEEVCQKKAHETQNGHDLHRDTVGILLDCLGQLAGGNLLGLAGLDVALAEAAAIREPDNFCLRGSQLSFDRLERLVAGLLDGRDGTAGQGGGRVYRGLFVGISGGCSIVVWRRSIGIGRGKVMRNVWGIGML